MLLVTQLQLPILVKIFCYNNIFCLVNECHNLSSLSLNVLATGVKATKFG